MFIYYLVEICFNSKYTIIIFHLKIHNLIILKYNYNYTLWVIEAAASLFEGNTANISNGNDEKLKGSTAVLTGISDSRQNSDEFSERNVKPLEVRM